MAGPAPPDDVSGANQPVVYILGVMSKRASVVALVVAAVPAAVLYALMWIGITANWGWLKTVDQPALGWFHDVTSGSPGWIGFWRGVSDVLGPTALRALALVGVVVALVRRRPRIAAFLTLAVITSALLTVAAKDLGDRPRPGTALVFAASTSFPSGHALGITVGVLAGATVLWPLVRPSMRIPIIAVGVALVVLVGLARVALNVHHPSDVIAGWALGLLCYLLCMTLVPPWAGSDRRIAAQSGL